MNLRDKLTGPNALGGIWINDGWVTACEMAAMIGFDFVVLDLEHSPHGLDRVVDTLRVLGSTETACVVRPTGNAPLLLKRLLDVGAQNLMVPMISTGAEARAMVADCRYPPAGRRGCASAVVRASGYGLDPGYIAHANDDLFLIAQIETVEGTVNAGVIAGTDGIDMIFIGPTDLSGSFGEIGAFDNPAYRDAVTKAEDAARCAGKFLGSMPVPGHDAKTLVRRGHRLIAGSSDLVLLRDGMKNALATLRPELSSGT